MPETLTTAFYAIWFGDDDYEFFDTEGEAREKSHRSTSVACSSCSTADRDAPCARAKCSE